MSDDDSRLDRLERALQDLTMDVRLMAQSMEIIKDAIQESAQARKDMQELDKRLIKVESAYGALKLLGTGAALSIIGLAVTALFGS